MKTFIISPYVGFDHEENLYYCKVGLDLKNHMPLLYTVWGLTKESCQKRAEDLVELLSNSVKIE